MLTNHLLEARHVKNIMDSIVIWQVQRISNLSNPPGNAIGTIKLKTRLKLFGSSLLEGALPVRLEMKVHHVTYLKTPLCPVAISVHLLLILSL